MDDDLRKEIKRYIEPSQKNLVLIYVLYLCGMVFPTLSIVGAVFAFANQDHKNDFLRNHYIFAFRTFAFGVLGGAVLMILNTVVFAFILSFALFTPILYILIFVWFFARTIVAMKYLMNRESHPNPLTFGIK
ncbi:hypothetical protein OAP56_04510 [Rickettsiaceae bacterium]|nr:hypothetical protein [Rickettsiaceae bacterium]